MEIKGKELFASVSSNNIEWKEIGKTDTGGKQPLKVLLGKTDTEGNNTDADNKGERTRCNVEYFSVLGEVKNRNKQDAVQDFEYLKDVEVNVNYAIYDGVPLISKWITVTNHGDKEVVLNSFTSEILAAIEPKNLILKNPN